VRDFGDFLIATLAGGSLSAVLILALGFICKSQLAHWLNKDIEKIKASHAKQMESFRTSLLIEVERTKAKQELKKSAGMRMVDLEVSVLIDAFRSLMGTSVDMLSMLRGHIDRDYSKLTKDVADFYKNAHLEDRRRANELMLKFRSAANQVEFFVTIEQRLAFIEYAGVMQQIIKLLANEDVKLSDSEFDDLSALTFDKDRKLVLVIKEAMNSVREL